MFQEQYQHDASRLIKVRALAQDASNAIYMERGVDDMSGCAEAWKQIHHMLVEEFIERYGEVPSQICEDGEGKFGPVPRYRGEDDIRVIEVAPAPKPEEESLNRGRRFSI